LSTLGTARYVIADRISRAHNIDDSRKAAEAFDQMLRTVVTIEPNDQIIEMAAEFEEISLELGLQLDTGESLLLAILLSTGSELLLTGDKRAIVSIENISEVTGYTKASGKIACLEQLITTFLDAFCFSFVRAKICKEEKVDRSVSICFSCLSPNIDVRIVLSGLASYIAALRQESPNVLITSDDLSCAIP